VLDRGDHARVDCHALRPLCKLAVPLEVDIGIGENWRDAK